MRGFARSQQQTVKSPHIVDGRLASKFSGVCRPAVDGAEWINTVSGGRVPETTTLVFPFKQRADIFGMHNRKLPAANVIVSERYKLAYVPIPKNACSALKLMFFSLRNEREFPGQFNDIHTKFDYKKSDFDLFAADTEHFKFMLVRDPLERFISAFNNRVLFYGELSESWFLKNWHSPEQVHAKFGAIGLPFNPDVNQSCRFHTL